MAPPASNILADRRAATPIVVPLVCIAFACVGCVTEERYQVPDGQVAMTADLMPAFVTEDNDPIYFIDAPFTFQITPPSDKELAKLTTGAQGMMLPFPRLPWVKLHDLSLQLDYAITNQSAATLLATVTLDGINEFNVYAPAALDLHQWQRRITLMPGQRVSGTVTEVELDEVAVDLATVVNGAPNSNLVVDFQSQHDRDPRVAQYVPKVVPGLVGLRAGILVAGQEGQTAPPLLLDLTIRSEDLEDRACKHGEKPWTLPTPAPFAPVVMDDET